MSERRCRDDDHVVSGSVEHKPTTRLVCKVKDESYRVYDPTDFKYCPMCGETL